MALVLEATQYSCFFKSLDKHILYISLVIWKVTYSFMANKRVLKVENVYWRLLCCIFITKKKEAGWMI